MSRASCIIPYNLMQAALAPVLGPPFLLYQLLRKKYRGQLKARIGLDLPAAGPSGMEAGSSGQACGPVWVHALSYGEVNAARPLIQGLRQAFSGSSQPPGLFLTASTMTGLSAMAELAEGIGAKSGVLPFDILPVVKRVVSRIRPVLFVLIETDIWPNLIWHLKGRKIPVLLINGSISQKAASRLRRLPMAAACLYGGFSFLAMQSEDDAERLRSLEIFKGGATGRIESFGNLKFDLDIAPLDAEERRALREACGFGAKDFVLVCGSTHPGEEEILLKALSGFLEERRDFKVVVAPRLPARAGEVLGLFRAAGIGAELFSRAGRKGTKVVVVDSLGKLVRLYGIGSAAFVGGSLVPVGGHNLLEPAAMGIPVMFGPYVESIKEAASALKGAGGGFQITGSQGLSEIVSRLLGDEGLKHSSGQAAYRVVRSNRGVTERYIGLIERFLPHHRLPRIGQGAVRQER